MASQSFRVFPQHFFQKINFQEIKSILANYCYGSAGKDLAQELYPSTQKKQIQKKHAEVAELKQILLKQDSFPMKNYEDVLPLIHYLKIDQSVLSPEDFVKLRHICLLSDAIVAFFNNNKHTPTPTIDELIASFKGQLQVTKLIDYYINAKGQINTYISPELMQVESQLSKKQQTIFRKFNEVLKNAQRNNWLGEEGESVRNGRRVLVVKAEAKRKVDGLVHDESASGKLIYIEPAQTFSDANDLLALEQQKKRIIYQLMAQLSEKIRPFLPELTNLRHQLAYLDFILAKARFAIDFNADKPQFNEEDSIELKEAFHPILWKKNKAAGIKTVPLSLSLTPEKRIIVVSGPNAGGKSVTLKNLALQQVMFQSGLPVTAASSSSFSIVDHIFLELGDEQSIENDLSTYSAHLNNLHYLLKNKTDKTLFLIDEFGAGTDPELGGALAVQILDDVRKSGAKGLITTHYAVLKRYVDDHPECVNAAMVFDQATLSPTYQFKAGRAGSSYAFEIAEKIGFDASIIQQAKESVKGGYAEYDGMLNELAAEKEAVQEGRNALDQKNKDLAQLIHTYESLKEDFEQEKARLWQKTEAQAEKYLKQTNKELENLIRDFKENAKIESKQAATTADQKARQALAQQKAGLAKRKKKTPKPKISKPLPLKVGDFAKMEGGKAGGEIIDIKKNKAVLDMGQIKMEVPLKQLVLTQRKSTHQSNNRQSVTQKFSQEKLSFNTKLDLRGKSKAAALQLAEDFVTKAHMFNHSHLTILHGTGDGVLRKAIRELLQSFDFVVEMKSEHPDKGGDGITLVKLS